MKKINILLVLVMLISSLLIAAEPARLVRLDVINDSGDTVYIKLNGKATGAFYYLTIAPGAKSFTVLPDIYARTTWACGYESKGSLIMTSNVRLKFTPCDRMTLRTVEIMPPIDPAAANPNFVVPIGFGPGFFVVTRCRDWAAFPAVVYLPCIKVPNMGEATMEKVQYFQFFQGYTGWQALMVSILLSLDWHGGIIAIPRFGVFCGLASVYHFTFKTPIGCYFRYRY